MSSFVINHFHNASPGIQSSSHDRTAQTAQTAKQPQSASLLLFSIGPHCSFFILRWVVPWPAILLRWRAIIVGSSVGRRRGPSNGPMISCHLYFYCGRNYLDSNQKHEGTSAGSPRRTNNNIYIRSEGSLFAGDDISTHSFDGIICVIQRQ